MKATAERLISNDESHRTDVFCFRICRVERPPSSLVLRPERHTRWSATIPVCSFTFKQVPSHSSLCFQLFLCLQIITLLMPIFLIGLGVAVVHMVVRLGASGMGRRAWRSNVRSILEELDKERKISRRAFVRPFFSLQPFILLRVQRNEDAARPRPTANLRRQRGGGPLVRSARRRRAPVGRLPAARRSLNDGG